MTPGCKPLPVIVGSRIGLFFCPWRIKASRRASSITAVKVRPVFTASCLVAARRSSSIRIVIRILSHTSKHTSWTYPCPADNRRSPACCDCGSAPPSPSSPATSAGTCGRRDRSGNARVSAGSRPGRIAATGVGSKRAASGRETAAVSQEVQGRWIRIGGRMLRQSGAA